MDRYRQLFTATYDGTNWTIDNNGDPIHLELNNAEGVNSFDIVIEQAKAFYLADHTAFQRINQITGSGQSNRYRRLCLQTFPHNGQSETVDQMIIQLTDVSGISTSDITSANIYVDDNNDGQITGGETTQVGGNGITSIAAGSGTITFSASFAVSGNTQYVLVLNIDNISSTDSINLSATGSDITLNDTSHLMTGETNKAIHVYSAAQPDSAGDIRLVYGSTDYPATTPRYRFVDADTSALSGAELPLAAAETIYYMETRLSATDNLEYSAVFSNDGTTKNLEYAFKA